MTRPADIPQDIWAAANATNHILLPSGVEKIARAILAERNRCAAKADHYTTSKHVRRARELTTQEVYEIKIFARLIAHDIRKSDPA